MTGIWRLYWLVLVVTLAIYTTMLLWSLPYLKDAAGGLMPFDLRPTGYSPQAAHAFLSALFANGSEPRDFYLTVQHRLDLFFPALSGLLVAATLYILTKGWPTIVRCVLILLPIGGAAFDYGENAAVANMLRLLPELASDEAIRAASRMTVLKASLVSTSLVIMLVLLAVAAVKHFRNRKTNT